MDKARKTAESSKKDDEASFTDVARPGKSSPHHTSRPIVVNQKSFVQDPMVRANDEAPGAPLFDVHDGDTTTDTATAHNKNKTVQPLEAEADAPTDDKNAVKQNEESPEPEKSQTEAESEQNTSEESSTPGETSQAAVASSLAEQAAKKESAQKTTQDQAYQEKVNQLIASKEYVVPVGHLKRNRKARHFLLVLLLIVLLGLVVLNFLLDAEVITISGIEPLTNIIGP